MKQFIRIDKLEQSLIIRALVKYHCEQQEKHNQLKKCDFCISDRKNLEGRFVRECELASKLSTRFNNLFNENQTKEVYELDLGNLEDLHKLVSMLDSNEWKVLLTYYKNGSKKPPFMVLGRTI